MQAKEFNRLLKTIKKDERSIEILYNYFYPRIVVRLSPRYGKEIAENAAQEFFIRLVQIAENQEYIEYPVGWVFKCAENIAKQRIQKEEPFFYLDEKLAFSYLKDSDEVYGDLYEAINKLDSDSQKILKMFYWEGYNQNEIAATLSLSAANVRQKHSRAIKKLKKFF